MTRGAPNRNRKAVEALHPRRVTAMQGLALAKKYDRLPLDVLLGVGNQHPDFADWPEQAVQCMIAAAPFVHPRLAAIAIQEVPDETAAARRSLLARIPFAQRREIAQILAAAQAQEEAAVGVLIDGGLLEATDEAASGADPAPSK